MSPPEIERAIGDLRDDALDLARRLSVESFASEPAQRCLDAAVDVQAAANMLGDVQRLLAATLVSPGAASPQPEAPGTSA